MDIITRLNSAASRLADFTDADVNERLVNLSAMVTGNDL